MSTRSKPRNERYRGVVTYGFKKGYRAETKVRTKREAAEVLRLEVPELRIVADDLWLAVEAQRRKVSTKPWAQARGSKPKHLLTGLAVCGAWGGGIKAKRGKLGTEPASVYHCGYHHDRGNAVCTNTLRRPVEEIDAAIIEWIRTNVLQEGIVKRVVAEVRRRIEKQAGTQAADLVRIDAQIAKLRKEVRNLSEAIAMADVSLPSLVERFRSRDSRRRRRPSARRRRCSPSSVGASNAM